MALEKRWFLYCHEHWQLNNYDIEAHCRDFFANLTFTLKRRCSPRTLKKARNASNNRTPTKA